MCIDVDVGGVAIKAFIGKGFPNIPFSDCPSVWQEAG